MIPHHKLPSLPELAEASAHDGDGKEGPVCRSSIITTLPGNLDGALDAVLRGARA